MFRAGLKGEGQTGQLPRGLYKKTVKKLLPGIYKFILRIQIYTFYKV